MKELTTKMREVDWNEISRRPDLPPRFIKKRADKLNWTLLMQNIPLTEDFLEEYKDYIDWEYMAKNRKIPQKYIDTICSYLSNHDGKVDWLELSQNLNLSEDFLMKLRTLDFGWLIEHRRLSDTFLLQKANDLDWVSVSMYQVLTEEMIETIARGKTLNGIYSQFWENVGKYQILSEDFIKRHLNSLDLRIISAYQSLSESFIEKYSNYIDWQMISSNQKLSDDFIIRHADDLDWVRLCQYQTLSESLVEKCIDKIDWGFLSAFQPMNDSFWIRHLDKFRNDWLDYRMEDERKSTRLQKKQKIMLTKNFECFDDYFFGLHGCSC